MPAAAAKEPARHGVGTALPARQKLPAGHGRHSACRVRFVAPSPPPYVPAAHALAAASGSALPAGHQKPAPQGAGAVLASGHAAPAGHGAQPAWLVRFAAALKVPGAQANCVAEEAPRGQ